VYILLKLKICILLIPNVLLWNLISIIIIKKWLTNNFITLPKTNKIYEVPFCSYVNKLLKAHEYLCLVYCVNSFTVVTLHFIFVGHIAKSSVEG